MFKLAFLVFAVGTFFCTNSISAEPNMLQEAMDKMPLAMQGVVKQLGGPMAQIAEMGKKLLGKFGRGQRERSKRSSETRYVVTSGDKANYQQVEVKHKWDNDHLDQQQQQQQPEAVTCLLKENEVFWLEMVSTALIYVSQEIKKVLNGKVIRQQMPHDMYNRTRI
ncbi:uncharacterized protein LOC109411574 [Aedes albopictus]|uniref:Secreted protein n=1 Tax=Aedes albopictus TaxID=7160 RepID=A0ABM1YPW4_AEDAL|nr:uncharacterized protein LOC109411574 [Aedes albopictus]